MQEIYFQTFSQCVPCPQRCFSFSISAISAFVVVAVNCVRYSVPVCQCVWFFFFSLQFALAMDVFRLKEETRNSETKTCFIHSTKDTHRTHTHTHTHRARQCQNERYLKYFVEIHSARIFSCDNQTGYSSFC